MDSQSFQTHTENPISTNPVAKAIEKVELTPKPGVELKPVELEAPQKTKEEETATQRFGVLARREQQHVRERQLLSAEKQKLESEQATFSAMKAKVSEEESLWESQPFEVLKRHGWDYDKLTQLQLNEGRPTPDMVARVTVKEELSAFEKKQRQEREKELENARAEEKKRFEETLNNFRQEVEDFIKSPEQQESCELIRLHDASEVVLATIEEHFQNTKKAGKPEVMSKKQACDLVEKYLEEQIEKSLKSKKLSSKANPEPTTQVKTGDAKPIPPSVPPRTINNSLTSSAQGARPLNREERIKRALALKVS